MKLKKAAAGILALSMVTAFAGCGKETDTAGVPTVSWYLIKPLEVMTPELVQQEVNPILREKVGAELELNLVDSGSWNEKMNLIISSGEKIDLMMTSETGPTSLLINSRRGAFMDLSQLLEQYGSAIKEKVDPRAWDSCTIDGKLLLIPSQGKYVSETAYVFKKDLVDKYGFDYKSVTCLEDLEPYLETIKQNEPTITPLYITASSDITQPVNENDTGTGLAFVYFDEQNEKFISQLDVKYDEYKLKHDFYQKGYIAKDAFTKQDAAEGKTGRYAVMRDTGAYTEDGSKSTAFYGFPCVETLVGRSLIGPNAFSSGNAISITSENPDKAMQVLNAVWEDPYLSNTLAYGVEGVDYKVVSGSTNEDKSVLPNSGSDQKWAIWHNWLGPLFDQWDSPWNTKESLNMMEENNKNAQLSKATGFLMDTSEYDAEIAALSEVHDAAGTVLKIGNMEDFDVYMADLKEKEKAAGMDELLAALNEQYVQWKNKK